MQTDFKRWRLFLCFVSEEMRSYKPLELWHKKNYVCNNLWRALALTKSFHCLMSSPEDRSNPTLM